MSFGKGAMETLTDYMYLIIAIVVGGLMFYFVAHYSGLFGNTQDDYVYGNRDFVSERIALEIKNCWERHRGGLDPNSDICLDLRVNATQPFTEASVTKFLDCKLIPNNKCVDGNCSFCTSNSFEDRDKVGWDVKSRSAVLEITYSGYERKIMVRELAPPSQLSPLNSTATFKVSIISPLSGSTFYPGQTILFDSKVSGGTQPYFYAWEVDGAFVPGSMASFNLSGFQIGTHFANVTVKDSANKTASARVSISVALENQSNQSVQPTGPCADIVSNGDPSSKLDVVFLGHGYTDLNQLYQDAVKQKNLILSYRAFSESSLAINFHLVNLSLDLSCDYGCSGIDRLICCDTAKVKNYAFQCPMDQIIVIVNNKKYGGGGYLEEDIAVTSINESAVVTHEFGHSFGNLGDEYSYGQTCSSPSDVVNCDSSSSCPKWSGSGLGCLEKCGCTNWYRPSDTCHMQFLQYDFCPVCYNELKRLLGNYGG